MNNTLDPSCFLYNTNQSKQSVLTLLQHFCQACSNILWRVQFGFVIPAFEHHKCFPESISACLCRGSRGYFRSEYYTGDESIATPRANRFLAPTQSEAKQAKYTVFEAKQAKYTVFKSWYNAIGYRRGEPALVARVHIIVRLSRYYYHKMQCA